MYLLSRMIFKYSKAWRAGCVNIASYFSNMSLVAAFLKRSQSTSMKTVHLNQQPTELYKILKFEGLVASGGDAKTVIVDGLVRVNGQIETQKRKKIMHDDVIEFNGESLQALFVSADA